MRSEAYRLHFPAQSVGDTIGLGLFKLRRQRIGQVVFFAPITRKSPSRVHGILGIQVATGKQVEI